MTIDYLPSFASETLFLIHNEREQRAVLKARFKLQKWSFRIGNDENGRGIVKRFVRDLDGNLRCTLCGAFIKDIWLISSM